MVAFTLCINIVKRKEKMNKKKKIGEEAQERLVVNMYILFTPIYRCDTLRLHAHVSHSLDVYFVCIIICIMYPRYLWESSEHRGGGTGNGGVHPAPFAFRVFLGFAFLLTFMNTGSVCVCDELSSFPNIQ